MCACIHLFLSALCLGIGFQRAIYPRSLQIIDIRVKQLQELYPQHLYFDTSFFGFLCPTTERVRKREHESLPRVC